MCRIAVPAELLDEDEHCKEHYEYVTLAGEDESIVGEEPGKTYWGCSLLKRRSEECQDCSAL